MNLSRLLTTACSATLLVAASIPAQAQEEQPVATPQVRIPSNRSTAGPIIEIQRSNNPAPAPAPPAPAPAAPTRAPAAASTAPVPGSADAPIPADATSGTTIVGDQESPIGLYITPWKDDYAERGLDRPARLVDEALEPIDPATFRRQIEYYETITAFRKRQGAAK
ncbi:hypothetical protein [Nevskia ramosa]|uniref:hypothetical protein n=1 Tax=Nevskia ramosa TaxID=64002 RepID=UPI0023556347|nr:hypothetical protein [Nevskia ramosa]